MSQKMFPFVKMIEKQIGVPIHLNSNSSQGTPKYFPQVNVLGKQNKSPKTLLCEARDVSNAQADLSLRHSHVL